MHLEELNLKLDDLQKIVEQEVDFERAYKALEPSAVSGHPFVYKLSGSGEYILVQSFPVGPLEIIPSQMNTGPREAKIIFDVTKPDEPPRPVVFSRISGKNPRYLGR